MSRAAFQHTLDSAKRTILLREIALLAIDSFRVNKVRFALTALGMVIGSASLILVVTIGLTGKQYAMKLLENIGPNMVEVEYSGGSSGSVGEYRNDLLTIDDERAVDTQVPAVAASSPMLEMHDRVSFGGGVAKDVLVLGVSPQYREVRHLIVTTGRFFDDTDEATHTKAAVVTIPFATQMFGSPEAAINKTFQLRGMPITIVGTFKESVDTFGMSEVADETILIPYSVARYFTGTDKVKQLFFSIRDKNDIPFAMKDIMSIIQSTASTELCVHSEHSGCHPAGGGTDRGWSDGDAAAAGYGDAGRGRRGHHEHHAGECAISHPRDRHSQGAGRNSARDQASVPDGGDLHFDGWRPHRRNPGFGAADGCAFLHGLQSSDIAVVGGHRAGDIGAGGRHLRNAARDAGSAARSGGKPEIRMKRLL